jgi:hypothetical protein
VWCEIGDTDSPKTKIRSFGVDLKALAMNYTNGAFLGRGAHPLALKLQFVL